MPDYSFFNLAETYIQTDSFENVQRYFGFATKYIPLTLMRKSPEGDDGILLVTGENFARDET